MLIQASAVAVHGTFSLKVLNLRNVICFYLKVLGLKTLGNIWLFLEEYVLFWS